VTSTAPERQPDPTPRFEGLVAIVTGSAWGIGSCYAERLAAEGAKVVLADVRAELVEKTASNLPDAISVVCDVSSASDVDAMVAAALDAYGRIDILVNNAGGAIIAAKPVWEIDESDWDTIVDINLKGMWLCSKAAFPAMRDNGRGKIVNIASTAALSAVGGRAPYAAAKGGVVAATHTMAAELGPFGITVNAIAPGYVEVPHPKETYTAEEAEMMKQGSIGSQAIKRVGTMDDMADVVLFFASRASDFVTGQVLAVNGGNLFH
jgi:NAD(P)-dependent dehydrogenase (short-subunit alcohol dehydrogenase family)